MQIVATTDGIPVDFYVHVDSQADGTGLRHMVPNLPAGSVLYADYTDYGWEDLFAEETGNR